MLEAAALSASAEDAMRLGDRTLDATPAKRAKLEHADVEQSGARTVRVAHGATQDVGACAQPAAKAGGGADGMHASAEGAPHASAGTPDAAPTIDLSGENARTAAARVAGGKPNDVGMAKVADDAPKAAAAGKAAHPAAEARKEQKRLLKEAERKAKEEAKAAAKEAEKKAKEEAKEAEKKAKEEAREAERKAKEEAKEAEKKAKEEAREAERKAKEEAKEAEKKAKEEAREAERKAKDEAKEAERRAKEAEREEARRAREAEREAKEAEKRKREEEEQAALKKSRITNWFVQPAKPAAPPAAGALFARQGPAASPADGAPTTPSAILPAERARQADATSLPDGAAGGGSPGEAAAGGSTSAPDAAKQLIKLRRGYLKPFEMQPFAQYAPTLRVPPRPPLPDGAVREAAAGSNGLAEARARAAAGRPQRIASAADFRRRNASWQSAPFKYLQFDDDRRPPYYGTSRKQTKQVTGRRPHGLATDAGLDYEVDSGCEWDSEPEGEELVSADEADGERGGGSGDDDDDDEGDDEDGWLVHSDDEGQPSGRADGGVVDLTASPARDGKQPHASAGKRPVPPSQKVRGGKKGGGGFAPVVYTNWAGAEQPGEGGCAEALAPYRVQIVQPSPDHAGQALLPPTDAEAEQQAQAQRLAGAPAAAAPTLPAAAAAEGEGAGEAGAPAAAGGGARKEAAGRGVPLCDSLLPELLLLVHGSRAGVGKLVEAFRAAHPHVAKSSVERKIHALCQERANIGEAWHVLPDILEAYGARMEAHAAAVRQLGAAAGAHAIMAALERGGKSKMAAPPPKQPKQPKLKAALAAGELAATAAVAAAPSQPQPEGLSAPAASASAAGSAAGAAAAGSAAVVAGGGAAEDAAAAEGMGAGAGAEEATGGDAAPACPAPPVAAQAAVAMAQANARPSSSAKPATAKPASAAKAASSARPAGSAATLNPFVLAKKCAAAASPAAPASGGVVDLTGGTAAETAEADAAAAVAGSEHTLAAATVGAAPAAPAAAAPSAAQPQPVAAAPAPVVPAPAAGSPRAASASPAGGGGSGGAVDGEAEEDCVPGGATSSPPGSDESKENACPLPCSARPAAHASASSPAARQQLGGAAVGGAVVAAVEPLGPISPARRGPPASWEELCAILGGGSGSLATAEAHTVLAGPLATWFIPKPAADMPPNVVHSLLQVAAAPADHVHPDLRANVLRALAGSCLTARDEAERAEPLPAEAEASTEASAGGGGLLRVLACDFGSAALLEAALHDTLATGSDAPGHVRDGAWRCLFCLVELLQAVGRTSAASALCSAAQGLRDERILREPWIAHITDDLGNKFAAALLHALAAPLLRKLDAQSPSAERAVEIACAGCLDQLADTAGCDNKGTAKYCLLAANAFLQHKNGLSCIARPQALALLPASVNRIKNAFRGVASVAEAADALLATLAAQDIA